MIKENIKYFNKTVKMALIDLKKLYKGAALGWFWLIAKPAVTIFVYWFAFAIGLRVGKDINNFPFVLWLISGLLPWLFINDIITTTPDSYKKYNYLVTKIKYPTANIPMFLSLARLIVNLLLTIIVIGIYYIVSGVFDIYLLQLPLYIALMFICFSALGSIFAILGSISKDLANLIKTLSVPLLFLSAIFFNTNDIKVLFVKNMQLFNPITFIVDGYRKVFIYKTWFFEDMNALIIFILTTILFIVIASFLYRKIARRLPDYL